VHICVYDDIFVYIHVHVRIHNTYVRITGVLPAEGPAWASPRKEADGPHNPANDHKVLHGDMPLTDQIRGGVEPQPGMEHEAFPRDSEH